MPPAHQNQDDKERHERSQVPVAQQIVMIELNAQGDKQRN